MKMLLAASLRLMPSTNLPMLLSLPDQRRVVAVAGYDAKAVDERVGVGYLQRVDHEEDIGVVFLADAVAQAGHHGKGVAQEHFLQVAVLVGVAIDLAQQDIAANFNFFQHAQERGNLCAAVFQIDKQGEF